MLSRATMHQKGLKWAHHQRQRILIQYDSVLSEDCWRKLVILLLRVRARLLPHISFLLLQRLLFLFLNWLMGSGETFAETFHNKLLKMVITLAP